MSIFGRRKNRVSSAAQPTLEELVSAQAAEARAQPATEKPVPAKGRKARKKAAEAAVRDASANAIVGLECLFPNGIADSGEGRFSQTVELGDTNYKDELFSVQQQHHLAYSQILGSLPPGSIGQLSVLNEKVGDVRTVRMLPEEGMDARYASEFNDILEERQRQGDSHIKRTKYFTWSVAAPDAERAASALESIYDTAIVNFSKSVMKVPVRRLDGEERVELLRRILRPQAPSLFSWEQVAQGRRVADFIAPGSVRFNAGAPAAEVVRRSMIVDERHVSVMHIRNFGTDLSDEALSEITGLPIPMLASLVFVPQNRAKMIGRVNTAIAVAQNSINDYNRQNINSGGSALYTPPVLETKAQDGADLRRYIIDHDQQVLFFQGLIVLFADSAEELKENEQMVRTVCQNRTIDVDVCWTKVKHAFTSAMPFAHPRPAMREKFRSLCQNEAGALNPFGGIAFEDDPAHSILVGQSSVTNLPNYIDLSLLPSPHMWIMGITGGGKGMMLKSILTWILLQSPRPADGPWAGKRAQGRGDQIFVFDFHNEYRALADCFGGTVSDVSALAETCINPLAITSAGTPVEPADVADSSDFFTALTESVLSRPMDPLEVSVLDRCIQNIYRPHIGKVTRPTLSDLTDELMGQPEEASAYLAKCYEIYTKGGLSCFNGQTNVEDNDFLQVFNCQGLQKTLRTFAILTLLQHVRNAVYRNFQQGRTTWCVVEEAQSLFDRKNTAAADDYPIMRVLDSFFSELRKFGLRMVCVTQLPEVVLDHPKAKNLFDNSGMFVFLQQSAANCQRVASLFNLSEAQASLMGQAEKGNGLLIVGNHVKAGFKNRIPKTLPNGEVSKLYELFNTDPERAAKEGQPVA